MNAKNAYHDLFEKALASASKSAPSSAPFGRKRNTRTLWRSAFGSALALGALGSAVSARADDFFYTGGFQNWIVPLTGVYTLSAWGAQGGNAGGLGAEMSGDFSLTAGQTISIAVGGMGGGGEYTGGGGGGGTFITVGGVALLVAGGGGGRYVANPPESGASASHFGSAGGSGGASYNGGGGGGGGGGFSSNGGNGADGRFGVGAFGGSSFGNGLAGGSGIGGGGSGGFGGGGGASTSAASGGGGGYNGGAGANSQSGGTYAGFGGGSVNNGFSLIANSAVRSGDGFAQINVVPEPSTFALAALGGMALVTIRRRRSPFSVDSV